MANLSQHSTYCVGSHNLGLDFFALADLSDASIDNLAGEWTDTVPSLTNLPHGVSFSQAMSDRAMFDRLTGRA